MSLADFPRHPLLFGPSPVQRLDRLTAHLGGATVWAKREDCNSGLAFGGNKVRKLEYLLADALAQGCDTLVSIGGVQSNHTRQVAAVSAAAPATSLGVKRNKQGIALSAYLTPHWTVYLNASDEQRKGDRRSPERAPIPRDTASSPRRRR